MVISYRCNLFSCFIHTVHLTPSTPPPTSFLYSLLLSRPQLQAQAYWLLTLGKHVTFPAPLMQRDQQHS